ncbi:hypothetical protein CHS0354_000905 [Potamilus streckersoni]|uniref:Uncharacterized protein n=1 Tax=Potamilus streckersoni TaxID=2493646 RepID=A0AAE0VQE1_9BIVA|nr:hypothetical protein CHS0354_000905 [Potamilus streckersoni]
MSNWIGDIKSIVRKQKRKPQIVSTKLETQPLVYRFPMEEELNELNSEDEHEENVSEEEIRKSVFGDSSFAERHLGEYDSSISRPTTASARRSVLWSRERKVYENAARRRMEEFKDSYYMKHQYPEIPKHYPGTWRVVTREELKRIVERLTRPTTASSIRSRSAAAYISRSRYSANQTAR